MKSRKKEKKLTKRIFDLLDIYPNQDKAIEALNKMVCPITNKPIYSKVQTYETGIHGGSTDEYRCNKIKKNKSSPVFNCPQISLS